MRFRDSWRALHRLIGLLEDRSGDMPADLKAELRSGIETVLADITAASHRSSVPLAPSDKRFKRQPR